MRLAVLAMLLALLAGCGSADNRQLAVSVDGRAVLEDAYDGRLDRDWSCGSLRAAVDRLPVDPPVYSTIPQLLREAAGRACDAALKDVHPGLGRTGVRGLLGRPDRSSRCWLYRWSSDSTSSADGARVCFAAGVVAFAQTAVHG